MANRPLNLAGALIAAVVIFPASIHADWHQAIYIEGTAVSEQAFSNNHVGAVLNPVIPAAAPVYLANWQFAAVDPVMGQSTWTTYPLYSVVGKLDEPRDNPGPDLANGLREGAKLSPGPAVLPDATTDSYQRHFRLVPMDWRDSEVSRAP
jgi:hypothetical protein